MKIGITGATGFIGKTWIDATVGNEIVGFTRQPSRPIPGTIDTRAFRLDTAPDLSALDALIHLAGESIIGLWTPTKKRAIRDSRVEGTRHLVESIAKLPAPQRPKTLVCASAIGLYGPSGDAELTESTPTGRGFLATTCQEWETEALRAQSLGLRVVLLRIGLVLGKNAGAMRLVMPLFRAGLGGQLGNGRQWMSWIRAEDVAGLIEKAITDPNLSGPVNATAPEPVRNKEFTEIVARSVHRWAPFGAPAWALRVGLGELSSILLDGQRVSPARALAAGYRFRFPSLPEAVADL